MSGTDDAGANSQPPDADIIAAAALRLAGQRGWRNLTMGDIAVEAGMNLSVLAGNYSSRVEILDGFERMIDRRMLAGAAAGDINDKPRDRLFDIIMERIDALLPHKDGIRRITRELPFDPASGLVLAAAMPRSIAWMYAGARISIAGPTMPLKLAVLGGVYLQTFRAWLGDDSQELGKTMATLDKQLDRAMSLIGGTFGRSHPAEPVPSEGPPDIVAPEPSQAEPEATEVIKQPAPVEPRLAQPPGRKPAAPRKKPAATK